MAGTRWWPEVERCEAAGVEVPCCPETVIGGLADGAILVPHRLVNGSARTGVGHRGGVPTPPSSTPRPRITNWTRRFPSRPSGVMLVNIGTASP